MNATRPPEQYIGRATRRWGWVLAVLVAAIAILLSFGPANGIQATADVAYVTDAGDLGADCHGAHGLYGHHCCVGAACVGYAQHEAAATLSAITGGGSSLPALQADRIGQILRPAPQPPQA
jgi:hypothetical protein